MSETSVARKETYSYDDDIVKMFLIATLVFGAVALLLGVFIALQLANWKLNLGLQWTTFGRLRPLHTNAAIFAFAGNGIFAGIYYSSQRLLRTRMYSDLLSRIHFWGWQAIIAAAAITLPLGLTVGKEYAELEWPIAWVINIVWVIFGFNFFKTLQIRRERHMYVAIWFYIGTIVTVALLHVLNTIQIPVSFWKSYPVYSGVQDALVQWWYGHNAVAFVLTTPFLGLMYYFLPKAADKPVYSYRLSIVHFWSLVFIYIWAGPHHLLYTALPDWAQTLGMVFSVMLIAPSWGGMINGLLTLRGAWDRVRQEPVLKFFVAGLTFYGMATFEGPLLSIKSVSALGHYTDWIIGHVHGGALGWNGFLIFAMTYWLVPKLWKTELFSVRMANAHFWIGFLGTVLYMVSMWVAGITQGLMWRAVDASGRLVYPDFVETVIKIVPLYWVRALGGTLYLFGFVLLLINVVKTVRSAPKSEKRETVSGLGLADSKPEVYAGKPHRMLEGLPGVFTVLSLVAVLVGTFFELAPTFLSGEFAPTVVGLKPYTGLQLHGRDIYVREGCYTCHSQMIRPLVWETKRYGDYSRAEESIYDRPFQWGSKRTGPDLARVGSKYPDLWHYRHMMDPREVAPGSIMPAYPWLFKGKTDFEIISKKLSVMKSLGVPYSDADVENAEADARREAQAIADKLISEGADPKTAEKEIIPLISYLQRLGQDYKKGAIK
ncbi:MAG: cytochrome-c oxidase, cbb3-type subunit I [Bdellovibrionales bacterium]|nr:cytochrome-c oxidase, cbb3-type subunit I [Bdellovibrionales bacterium]